MKTNYTEYIILVHARGDYLITIKPDGEIMGGSANEATGYADQEAQDLCKQIGNCSYESREVAIAADEENQ